MADQEVIQLEIKGKNNQPVPLLSAVEALREFHYTVDKSFVAVAGKDKIFKRDRESYKIVANNLRTGSIFAELVIVFIPPMLQGALAFEAVASDLSIRNIWDLTKNSFNFLKALAESKHKGRNASVTQHANPYGLNLNISGDGNTIILNVGEKVVQTASRSEQHIKKLAGIVGKGNIDVFKALDSNKEGILLTPRENRLFNPQTFIDKNAIELNAKIFRLDVEGKNGRLRVIDEQFRGEYSFNIIGNQQIAYYINALGAESTQLTVLKEIIKHPTGEETLAGFQVVGIASATGDLFSGNN